MHKLAKIRKKYDLPTTFSMVVLEDISSCSPEPRFVTLYEDTLAAGLRLSFHPLARDLLIFLGITPGQLAPNGWWFLMGAAYLWPQRFGCELSLQEFLWSY